MKRITNKENDKMMNIKKQKIEINGEKVGEIIQQQKSNNEFIANVTLTKIYLGEYKQVTNSGLSVWSFTIPNKIINAYSIEELNKQIVTFIQENYQYNFEIVDI